jgi:hypothetical protein
MFKSTLSVFPMAAVMAAVLSSAGLAQDRDAAPATTDEIVSRPGH